MTYNFFSHNGKLLPVEQAVVSLSNIEFAYGFGVYETVRVSGGKVYFAEDHCKRLMESSAIIGLEHPFSADFVQKSISDLVKKLDAEACNLKILLIGAPTKEAADVYIMALSPFFPNRNLYRSGAHCITELCERKYPHAKTLNMLPSYLAYRKAKAADAYDALLVNRDGNITEGTRTNFFGLQGKTIISPPESDILLGVTRSNVLKIARQNGFEIIEQHIKPADFPSLDSAFLTSTSSKIIPISSIDEYKWEQISPSLKELMADFGDFLATV